MTVEGISVLVMRTIFLNGAGAPLRAVAALSTRLHMTVGRSIVGLALAAALVSAMAVPASADFVTTDTTTTSTDTTLIDPLQGYCSVGCLDNGTNSPTTQNPISGFGFVVDPGPNTGDLLLDVLVPNNETQPTTADLAVTGTGTGNLGTATLVNTTAWTTGQLDTYLGISASPTNPIGAYDACSLPAKCANFYDPGITGFYVYQVDLGTTTLYGPSKPNTSPLLNIGALPIGSYIVGFLYAPDKKGNYSWIATANSGAIFETHKVPEPASLALLSTCLVGFGLAHRLRKRRRSVAGQSAS